MDWKAITLEITAASVLILLACLLFKEQFFFFFFFLRRQVGRSSYTSTITRITLKSWQLRSLRGWDNTRHANLWKYKLYFEPTNLYFSIKNLYFLKTYTNRLPLPHFITRIFITSIVIHFMQCAVLCCIFHLPAMLKSAGHNVHLAWFSPFLDGLMKSQLREYSSLKVCFLLFLDAITLINCIKYPGKICF